MKDPRGTRPDVQDEDARPGSYEAPRVTSVGNARDILGKPGSVADAPCAFCPSKLSTE
jgi:hypothetical protein